MLNIALGFALCFKSETVLEAVCFKEGFVVELLLVRSLLMMRFDLYHSVSR